MKKNLPSCVVLIIIFSATSVFSGDIYYPTEVCSELWGYPPGTIVPERMIFDPAQAAIGGPAKGFILASKQLTFSFFSCSYVAYRIQALGNGKCKNVWGGSAGTHSVINKSGWESYLDIDFETIFDCVDPNKQLGAPVCT